MQAILTIILNDLRIFFSRRGNLIGLLVIPILLTLVLGFSLGGTGGGPTRLRVDLIDLDQTEMSARLIDELHAANAALALCPLDNDADDYCQLEGGATQSGTRHRARAAGHDQGADRHSRRLRNRAGDLPASGHRLLLDIRSNDPRPCSAYTGGGLAARQ